MSDKSAPTTTKPSGLKPPSAIPTTSRITRLCTHSHQQKEPTTPQSESKLKMRRQSEEFTKSTQLADVDEENESDLLRERFTRTSISPDSWRRSKTPDRKCSSISSHSDGGFWEATGRRLSSDQGGVLTTDTDSFIVGDRIYVGGVRSGRIAFIGETHFAPGEWAGIVLDEPNGKNDGCVSGKRYFQCEAKKGIFARLTRLTREPLSAPMTPDITDGLSRSIISPARSGTVSPTHSVTSTASKTPASKSKTLKIGDRVIVSSSFGSKTGTLEFMGETQFATGTWCGVQLDEANGKNDGMVNGVRYFECPANYGIFVPIAKVSLSPMARKSRVSRAGSIESLNSNVTTPSLASTTASKMKSAQRLSTLNRPTSTPKVSYSLQDVLREKNSHIEKLITEREIDREELTNQTLLYQKNIIQLKEKIANLESSLDEEKKRSEDLQFRVDEATITGEDFNAQLQNYRKKTEALEKELNFKNKVLIDNKLLEAGDFVDTGKEAELAAEQTKEKLLEYEKLKNEHQELLNKLHLQEDLRKTLENQIQSMQEQVQEAKDNLDLKDNSSKVSDEVLRDEINYFTKRVSDLEVEIMDKDRLMQEMKTKFQEMEERSNEEITLLERQMKDRDSRELACESALQEIIIEKDAIIENIRKDLEELQAKQKEVINSNNENESNFKSAKSEIDVLKKEIQSMVDQKNAKEQELIEMGRNVEAIRKELTERCSKLEEREKELLAKSESLKELEVQVKNLTENLKLSEQNLNGKLSALEKLEETVAQHQKIESDLNQTLNQLTEKKEFLETELIAKDKLLEANKIALTNLESRLENVDKSNEQVHAELEAARNSEQAKCEEIKQLQEHVEALKESLSQQQQEAHQMQKSFEENAKKLNGEIENVRETEQKKLQELSGKLDEKEANINSISKQLSESSTINQHLQQKLTEAGKEIEALTESIGKVEREKAEKSDKIEKLEKQLQEMQKTLETSNLNGQQLQNTLSNLEVDFADLKRKLEMSEDKCANLQEQKNNLDADLEKARSSSIDSNSELSRLSNLVRDKEKALEALQDVTKRQELDFERRIHELNQGNSLLTQQLDAMKLEMSHLMSQKMEKENELNVELDTIKTESERERENLRRQIAQLQQEMNEKVEQAEKLKTDLHDTINALEVQVSVLKNDVDESRERAEKEKFNLKKEISELNEVNHKFSQDLELYKVSEENLKKSFADLVDSKQLEQSESTKSLQEKISEISLLETRIQELSEQLNATQQDKEGQQNRILDISQSNSKLTDELANLNKEIFDLRQLLDKSHESYQTLAATFKHMEDEQVDLVNRNEEFKQKVRDLEETNQNLMNSCQELEHNQRKIAELEESVKVLENKLFDKENQATHQENLLKSQEAKIQELENVQKNMATDHSAAYTNLLEEKKSETVKFTEDLEIRGKMIETLTEKVNSLESCLSKNSLEISKSSTELVELQESVSHRDVKIQELQQLIKTWEQKYKEQESLFREQVKQKELLETESSSKMSNLHEKVELLERQKAKEVQDLTEKLSRMESLVETVSLEAKSSATDLQVKSKSETEMTNKFKDLERRETELLILNQTLKRELEEMKKNSNLLFTDAGAGDDNADSQSQIAFLNSIIADMHKKNVKLTQRVQLLESSPADASQTELQLLETKAKKKKPPPRVYCDICEEFDAHETEDCPLQCSDPDIVLEVASMKEKKERKLPPPRKYCESCEMFDHEFGECFDEEY